MQISGYWHSRCVELNGKVLSPSPSQAVYNHSPDGFNWGYLGSGPAQLALAILLKCTDRNTAVALHQEFKRDVIAGLPQGDFTISLNVKSWISKRKVPV